MFSSSATSKRRRTSMSSSASVASREDDAASATSDQDYQPEAKRKRTISVRRDPDDDPIEQCQQLYDIIRNVKKETSTEPGAPPGGLLCEAFIRVPKRRQEPAYYEVVNNPMDMLRIQQKIKMDEYDDIEQMASDVELMVSNAKAFYKRGSQEHKDACDLWQIFLENKERLFDGEDGGDLEDNQDDSSTGTGDRKGKIILKLGKLNARRAAESRKSTSAMDDEASETSSTTTDKQGDDHDNLLFDNLEELFTSVMVAKDADDRPLHTVFQLLPSKRHYPNYYEIIDTPIDLKMIAGKIQGGEYGGLQDLEKDLTAMFRNACTFNEPGSQIYKDAKTLKRIVSGKRAEIENRKVATSVAGKTSERIRQRRLRGGLSHSAITAALQYEDDSEEEEEEGEEEDDEEDDVDEEEAAQEEDEEMEVDEEGEVEDEEEDGVGEGEEEEYGGDKEDPMWLLFEHIFNYGGGGEGGGVKMSEPFKRLPSRRYYPDYYKEIKQPIALSKIRGKLTRGEYDNLTQVQADMNVMFENAKTYNRPDSALYKTAVKLQRAMQTKAMELLDREVEGVSSGGEGEVEPVKRNINSTPIPTLIMEGGGAAMEGFPVQMNIPDKPPGLEIQAPAQVLGQVPQQQQQVMQVHLQVPVVPVISAQVQQQAPPPVFTKIVTTVPQQVTSPKKVGGGGGGGKKGRESGGGGGGGHGGLTISTKTNPHKGLSEREDPKAIVVREEIKKRLRLLYGTLVDYQQADGRCPISLFMEKPSKKQYPDYYKVIVEPIDMLTIKQRIDGEGYNGTDELVKDFRLMFNNCRQYNEEGSLIYEDANKLEQVLNDKLRVIGPDPSVKPKKKKKRHPALLQKQKRLLETIKEFRDKNGRQLSTVFQKLPTKAEYPEYYEVIKSPIDLEKICNKQRNGTYESLDHIANDFMQMFDNACKFNEPDSQIYKDALILQRLLLQTKLTISSEDGIPDVACSVREILTSIFTSVYNHQDEEGRCYSDTMAELPEFDEVDGGQRKRAISLDLIKNRLDRGFYKRLDVFQKDMFLCFERARKNSRTDSQLFEDSIELHSFFIRTRDELTGKGEVLQSPALDYSLLDLEREVATLRAEKGGKESPHDEDLLGLEVKKEDGVIFPLGGTTTATGSPLQQMESYNDQVYCVGDFVYVSSSYNAEPSSGGGGGADGGGGSVGKPNIANIQKLWTAPDGTKMFDGIWFFRPDQTYHLPTRKFLQKEVFRSEVRSTAMLSEIVGKCWVMTVKGKEYFNLRPEGYNDEDVYVCEYRYASRARSFTKLKLWPFGSERVKLVQRQKVLEPVRVVSVFSERVANHKEEMQKMDDESEKMPPQQEFPNIRSPIPGQGLEDKVFYEQYNLPFGPVRMGDYVYVRVENGKKLVARIDSMWTDSTSTAYFHGPWFTSISEVSTTGVPPGRTFYQQEIFQSSIEDTNPLLSICGKCSILDIDDYKKRRPTEIPEKDVFICESLYDEARREICPFKGLKKIFCKDPFVHRDEVYFFRKPIPMVRVDIDGTIIHESAPSTKKSANQYTKSLQTTTSTFTPKMEPPDHSMDSMDFSPPSVGGSDSQLSQGMTPTGPTTPMVVSTPIVSTPVIKKAKTPGKKLVTGYILYSSENRKSVAEKNPNKGFGEISRMVGTDWRKMPQEEKTKYEERAQKINQAKEAAAKEAQAEANAAAAAAAVAAAVSAAANGSNSNMSIGDTSFQGAVLSSGLASPQISTGTPLTATPGGGKGKDGSKEGVDMVTATQALKKDPDWIFECCWDGCDWQFEDALDLIEHCVQEPKGHVPEFFKDVKNPNEGEFQCHWKNCTRVKKGVNPFPTLSRLLKHVKDIHVMKGNGRIIHPDMRSKRVMSSRNPKAAAVIKASKMGGTVMAPVAHIQGAQQLQFLMPQNSNSPALISASGQQVQPAQAQAPARPAAPAEPLFVAVPPRPQKLLHSEAYIRYIESLHAKKRKMTDWEKTLKATKENTKIPDETKLPRHWLGNGAGVHGSTTQALWALRDFMMRDALNLHKTS